LPRPASSSSPGNDYSRRKVTRASAAADPFELQGLLTALSARDSAPAGGSAAAIVAAVAAAVVAKAARRSGDEGAAAQASALADRLTRLAALDADVFAAALEALRHATERGQEAVIASESRDFQLGRTLDQAAAVPLAIAEAAADVALLASEVARAEGSELREDAAAAALLAAGAARAAAHLVAINLASRPDIQAQARAAVAAATAAASGIES
jgi:methenyltetrahydrofolate cyclohydrolase